MSNSQGQGHEGDSSNQSPEGTMERILQVMGEMRDNQTLMMGRIYGIERQQNESQVQVGMMVEKAEKQLALKLLMAKGGSSW
ncbi:hypothetical protein IFM89_035374 [Coptis chinensis]|uniref:Uncharacterized protein n=1 Tax=Coptis chinensis TaxID=261450 RepID=A0A835M7V3_9MAGN|nr:hypothetical protein IFM89_035374 [Coptis chinensis]